VSGAPARGRGLGLGDGTAGQKALFAALVGVFAIGLVYAVSDKFDRIGEPNVGWLIDTGYVSPSRADVSEAGLRGGGRAIAINGVALEEEFRGRIQPTSVRTEIGAVNTLVFQPPHAAVREISAVVRPWTARDIVFTEGATDVIGALFFAVGLVTFLVRPYEAGSWALLALCSFSGATLLTILAPIGAAAKLWMTLYYLLVVGVTTFVPYHTALAFPVAHPLLLRRPRVLWLIYGLGFLQGILNIVAWFEHYAGRYMYVRRFASAAILVAIACVIGRTARLAFRPPDRLTGQRARILLAGGLAGLAPFGIAQFLQQVLGTFALDARFTFWPLGLFVFALARVTVRYELMNARIALRRGVLYAAAVAVLTIVAALLSAWDPFAVAVLLFPLPYLWPRFQERLDRRLYPQRARLPELVREIGGEMAAGGGVDEVLDTLADAPRRLCDATGGVAFVFAGPGERERVRTGSGPAPAAGAPLAEEPLVQLLRTTRREIRREQIFVEPFYANVRHECEAGFQRLAAALLLPLEHRHSVIGGLAVGPRASGDVYDKAEVDALSTVVQQATQAIVRIEATERLRARETEFSDLKRFFPPQIIDQVMARGGAAELRSQRKRVTVVFADLRGFTSFSESVEPEEVMTTLAEYHAVMGRRIAEYAGTLERFAGDGFMVFFNDPVDQPDHAERGVAMARAMQVDMDELRERWSRKGYRIHLGIGIDSGYATCGFVGYEGRREYAVIGNVSNLAARLSDAAAPGEILVSARVYAELTNGHAAEPMGELSLKGFHQPQPAYRLINGKNTDPEHRS
jgi:class 3 adenylate cyclase